MITVGTIDPIDTMKSPEKTIRGLGQVIIMEHGSMMRTITGAGVRIIETTHLIEVITTVTIQLNIIQKEKEGMKESAAMTTEMLEADVAGVGTDRIF